MSKKIVSKSFFKQFYLFLLNQLVKDEILYALYGVLVEQSNVGLFIPEDHHDILVEVIGNKEHPRRVCGLGRGIGFKTFYGRSRLTREVYKK